MERRLCITKVARNQRHRVVALAITAERKHGFGSRCDVLFQQLAGTRPPVGEYHFLVTARLPIFALTGTWFTNCALLFVVG